MSARPAYITPTQLAEEAYQAGQQRRPRMRRPYRPCDRDALSRVAREAFEAHRAEQLPDHERATVAAALADHLEVQFDRADMVVLERHGFAREIGAVSVALIYARAEQVILPRALLVPVRERFQCFDLRGRAGTAQLPLPAPCVPFFERVETLAAEREPFLQAVSVWPLTFKRAHGRPPTWGEIAAAWPRLAKRIEAL